MRALLIYLLQVIIASGILYGYYCLALRNKKFHQFNRFYLIASFIISILVPFLNIPVYLFPAPDVHNSFVYQPLQNFLFSDSPAAAAPITSSPVTTHYFNWNIVPSIIYAFIV